MEKYSVFKDLLSYIEPMSCIICAGAERDVSLSSSSWRVTDDTLIPKGRGIRQNFNHNFARHDSFLTEDPKIEDKGYFCSIRGSH